MTTQSKADLARTPLHALHLAAGARMVDFAGYAMPVQYPPGIMKEHLHTRAAAGLFDVSHMGQIVLRAASGQVADAARALERLVCADVVGLTPGRQRYALFTAEDGGILDDLMVANLGDRLFLVVNAACKVADEAHLRAHLGAACTVEVLADRALIAVQGPMAEAALSARGLAVADMRFMDVREMAWQGADCLIARSGYTGEDGFEISLPAGAAAGFAQALLDDDRVQPVGLGARDTLRLEAGLCLYGHDIDRTTTPAEAALGWAIGKPRRTGGVRAGGFPGAAQILAELETGPSRLRVGLRPEGRAPVRDGAGLYAGAQGGERIGTVTSGGFGPSVGAPIAMGYVPSDRAAPGTTLFAEVRGKRLAVTVSDLPFIKPTYRR